MTETIVLLTLDAARADHCSTFGYDRQTTPQLSKLASQGTIYTQCISQSSHTRESMPSLLYSLYPSQLRQLGVAPSDRPSIAELFADAGYETAGFHSNPYLSRAYGFDAGFDTFDDDLPRLNNKIVTFLHRVRNYFQDQPYVTADSLVSKARTWLDETAAERRFLWLHFMDPHGPYQPPERYQRLYRDDIVGPKRAKSLWRRSVDEPESLRDEDVQTLVDLYDAEITYTDAIIGEFVDDLRTHDDTDAPLVVIGADHGDAFGEHGIFGHPRSLYEELVHVPLLVLGDDVPSGNRIDQPVSNVDIGPTLATHADMDVPASFVGTPLPGLDTGHSAPTTGEPVVFTEAQAEDAQVRRWAARNQEFKYYLETDPNGTVVREVLWSLSADDTEGADVGSQYPAVRHELANALADHLDAVGSDHLGLTPDSGPVDSVVSDRLEDLGYR